MDNEKNVKSLVKETFPIFIPHIMLRFYVIEYHITIFFKPNYFQLMQKDGNSGGWLCQALNVATSTPSMIRVDARALHFFRKYEAHIQFAASPDFG